MEQTIHLHDACESGESVIRTTLNNTSGYIIKFCSVSKIFCSSIIVCYILHCQIFFNLHSSNCFS